MPTMQPPWSSSTSPRQAAIVVHCSAPSLPASLLQPCSLPFAFDRLAPRQRSLPLPASYKPVEHPPDVFAAVEPRRRRISIHGAVEAVLAAAEEAPRRPSPPPKQQLQQRPASPPPPPTPPTPKRRCAACGTTSSPEWRRKPSEKDKSLCNACGLRYARNRARQQMRMAAATEQTRTMLKHTGDGGGGGGGEG